MASSCPASCHHDDGNQRRGRPTFPAAWQPQTEVASVPVGRSTRRAPLLLPRHHFLHNTTSTLVTSSDEGCSDAQLLVLTPRALASPVSSLAQSSHVALL